MQGIIPCPRQAAQCSHQPPTSPSIDAHLLQQRMGKRTFDQAQQSATAEKQRHPKCSRIVAQRASADPRLNGVGDRVSRELTAPNAPTHINPREWAKQQAIMHWLSMTTIEYAIKCFVKSKYAIDKHTNNIDQLSRLFGICKSKIGVGVDATLMRLIQTNFEILNEIVNAQKMRRSAQQLFRVCIHHLYRISGGLSHQQSATWSVLHIRFVNPECTPLTAYEWRTFAKRLRPVSEASYWLAQTILHSAQSIYENARNDNPENLQSYALPQIHMRLPIQELCNAKIDQISWEEQTIAINKSTTVLCKQDFMERLSTYINGRTNGHIFCDTQSEQGIVSPLNFDTSLSFASNICLDTVDYLTLLQTAIAFADSADTLKPSNWLDATTVRTAWAQFLETRMKKGPKHHVVGCARAILAIFRRNGIVPESMSLREFAAFAPRTLHTWINTASEYTDDTRLWYHHVLKSFFCYLSQVSAGSIHEASDSWQRTDASMSKLLTDRAIKRPLTNTEWTEFTSALKNDSLSPSYLIATTMFHGAQAIYRDYWQCSLQRQDDGALPYLVEHFWITDVLNAQIEDISFDKNTITFDENKVRFHPDFMKEIQEYVRPRMQGPIFIDGEGNKIQEKALCKAFKKASIGIHVSDQVTPLTLLDTALLYAEAHEIPPLLFIPRPIQP